MPWLVVVVWGLAVAARGVAQAPDPDLTWHTLTTAHFDITYHDPLEPLAQRLAVVAEHASRVLSRALGYRASERTLILLLDHTDEANGMASVLPRNEIQLYASAPDDLSPIGDYDDWLATLVIHEHTHILHIDQIGGVAQVLNALLGKSAAPNAVQPRWFIEGLATYEETHQTSGGRGRSSLFDMMLRMDVLSEKFLSIDQLSNDPVRWPHGDLRYLYGSRFVTFIAERHGDDALAQLGRDYGRQTFPYGLNRIAKRATGFTFIDLYEQFHAALRERYGAQRDAIVAEGEVEGRPISPHADTVRSPRFLRDGGLAFYRGDGSTHGGLYTLAGELLTRSAGEAVFAPHASGTQLIYSQVAPYRDIYGLHDLFRLDLKTGESVRLTTGLRASQPDVSPDGREVAFITQKSGTSQLELAALRDIEGTRRALIAASPHTQVFTPRYSPDGKTLAVSVWRAGGYRDIVLVDRKTGAQRDVTRDRAQDTGPTFSPDGTRVYFSSDRSGVANIYAFELARGVTSQVTNVVAGAYQPVVSPDGAKLVYVGYTSDGFGLHELDLATAPERLAEPYHDRRPSPATTNDASARPRPIHDYNPLQTLAPHNYQLSLEEHALGYELGIHVAGSDVAGFHRYRLHVAVGLEQSDPGVSLHYAYGRSPLSPAVGVFRQVYVRTDLRVGGQQRRWFAEHLGASAGVSYRFPSVMRSQRLDFDYSLVHVERARPFGGGLDPNDPPPRLPILGWDPSAGFGYRYSDVTRQSYDVSASSGQSFGVRVDATDPIMGREQRSVSLRLSGRKYVAMPWLQQHVLAAGYLGGFAGGDGGRVGVFSLGGFPEDTALPSLYDFAVFGSLPSLGGVALRGYPQGHRSGRQFHLLQTEYRFPLFAPEWGPYTLPLYLRRVFADLFADVGNAFSDLTTPKDVLVGVGAELFATFELSYRVSFHLRIGMAHGLGEGGETQFYAHIGSPF